MTTLVQNDTGPTAVMTRRTPPRHPLTCTVADPCLSGVCHTCTRRAVFQLVDEAVPRESESMTQLTIIPGYLKINKGALCALSMASLRKLFLQAIEPAKLSGARFVVDFSLNQHPRREIDSYWQPHWHGVTTRPVSGELAVGALVKNWDVYVRPVVGSAAAQGRCPYRFMAGTHFELRIESNRMEFDTFEGRRQPVYGWKKRPLPDIAARELGAFLHRYPIEARFVKL